MPYMIAVSLEMSDEPIFLPPSLNHLSISPSYTCFPQKAIAPPHRGTGVANHLGGGR